VSQESWMLSNRQPWVEGLLRGYFHCKTRSLNVNLPPEGATVFLHASKALWRGWKELPWIAEYGIDPRRLDRGGVCGVAQLIRVGPTPDIMPRADRRFFQVVPPKHPEFTWNCADDMAMYFDGIKRIPFIPCRGAMVPTRKLPTELLAWIQEGYLHL